MNYQKLEQREWYRQETESVPYFIYRPCCGCLHWLRDKAGRAIWFCGVDLAKEYMSKDLMRILSEKCLADERRRPGNIDKLFAQWIRKVKFANDKLFSLIDKIELKKISDKRLLAFNRALADNSFKMWTFMHIEIFDLDAEGLAREELIKQRADVTETEMAILMSQENLITHQRSELELLKMARLFKNTVGAVNTLAYIASAQNLHRLQPYPLIAKSIENYQKRYFWIQNSWASNHCFSFFEVVDNLKQIVFGPRNIEDEIISYENFVKTIKARKLSIIRKYHISSWGRRLFHFFGVLSYWRDERKSQVQMLNHYLEMVGTEIARRSGLDWNDIKICDPLSINVLPVKKTTVKKFERLFRLKPAITWNGRNVIHLDHKQGERTISSIDRIIYNSTAEIRGAIACTGKARGEVVVIIKKSDFYKMVHGKVLVTTMTRPEFTPLMKMASAIITDEGGITSHAAVVSRELRVPCVIGTQIATKKLKDGDFVFVNADHGVITVNSEKV